MPISNMSTYASNQTKKKGTENLYWLGIYDKMTMSTIKFLQRRNKTIFGLFTIQTVILFNIIIQVII